MLFLACPASSSSGLCTCCPLCLGCFSPDILIIPSLCANGISSEKLPGHTTSKSFSLLPMSILYSAVPFFPHGICHYLILYYVLIHLVVYCLISPFIYKGSCYLILITNPVPPRALNSAWHSPRANQYLPEEMKTSTTATGPSELRKLLSIFVATRRPCVVCQFLRGDC